MGDALMARYWCHACSQIVIPIMEAEIKCPFCESGFVEEMDSTRDPENDTDLGSERAISLLAPILLGLIGGSSPPLPRIMTQEHSSSNSEEEEAELERELESFFRSSRRRRRRRRSSASVLRMLQDLHSGMDLESENSESDRERTSSVILVNPFSEEAVIVQGSFDLNQTQNTGDSAASSLGDYLTGPGLDLLLQHLAENDPNRYGTPPAQKEAVEAMPTVTIDKNYQCSVCLEDFEIGDEAKEMPCKHKFHSGCILPWLELHSSCPVCRLQIPSDDSKIGTHVSGDSHERAGSSGREEAGEGRTGNGRRNWVPITWPFSGFLPLSGSQGDGNSSSESSTATPGNAPHTGEN
ncbi:hypothetical protein L1049_008266 [Liquidambar formosana]|uniref:RING-type E3 ubiquitin transferase n=1 Tax=Liquidambar formosana TaxID=63359 RepID=A0AAP0S952_LIQFO